MNAITQYIIGIVTLLNLLKGIAKYYGFLMKNLRNFINSMEPIWDFN